MEITPENILAGVLVGSAAYRIASDKAFGYSRGWHRSRAEVYRDEYIEIELENLVEFDTVDEAYDSINEFSKVFHPVKTGKKIGYLEAYLDE